MENTTSLWDILGKTHIEIPLIQRDYAQGRIEEEPTRGRFLEELKKRLSDDRQPLVLDFVYGTEEHGVFRPLDGQQRLTTLWLLHWFVAWKAAIPVGEPSVVLGHFSYEVRMSAKDFCRRLSASFPDAEKTRRVSSIIRNQSWYSFAYDQDPTVRAMLVTLDHLQEILSDWADADFKAVWVKLTSSGMCPVVFHYKSLNDRDMPMSDDLYVKMNARGKPLTNFENFKADLVKELDLAVSAAIDNEWMDVLWANRIPETGEVDDIYLELFRRYVLNWYAAGSDADVKDVIASELYRKIYKRDNDSVENKKRVRYTSMRLLEPLIEAGMMTDLAAFMNRFADFVGREGLANVEEMARPGWRLSSADEQFSLVPRYVSVKGQVDDIASLLTMKGRVAFYAACRYFERVEEPTSTSFRRWMRFTWNIIENCSLETEEAMVYAMRFFRGVSEEHTADVAAWLAKDGNPPSNFAARQMEEERRKAKLESQNGSVWEPLITRAERTALLRGFVGCLLRDGEYQTYANGGSSALFERKLNRIDALFSESGVRESSAVEVTAALVRQMPSWDGYFYNAKFCDVSAARWKEYVLKKEELGGFVDLLLTTENVGDIPLVPWENAAQSAVREKFLSSHVLEDPGRSPNRVVCNGSRWRFRFQYPTAMLGFYPERRQDDFFVFDYADAASVCNRNELLLEVKGLEEIVEADGSIPPAERIDVPYTEIEKCPKTHYNFNTKETEYIVNPRVPRICKSWDVRFDYGGRKWLWARYRDGAEPNRIYLLDAQGSGDREHSITGNAAYTPLTFRQALKGVLAACEKRIRALQVR